MNPPYGERLAQDKNVVQLYQSIGTTLKHQFAGATAWIISSNEEALKSIGLKPSQKVHLLNGELDCLFCRYDLFSGTHKDFKTLHPSKEKQNEKKDFTRKKPFNKEKRNSNPSQGGAVSRPHPKNKQRVRTGDAGVSPVVVWNKLFDHTTPYLGAQANSPAPFTGRGQGAGQFATRKFVNPNS